MNLKLHERRTKNSLINSNSCCENDCHSCGRKNSATPLGPLNPNEQGLVDKRGIAMTEHKVRCGRCGAEWIDVFCRVYPTVMEEPDTQSEDDLSE